MICCCCGNVIVHYGNRRTSRSKRSTISSRLYEYSWLRSKNRNRKLDCLSSRGVLQLLYHGKDENTNQGKTILSQSNLINGSRTSHRYSRICTYCFRRSSPTISHTNYHTNQLCIQTPHRNHPPSNHL